MGSRPPSIVGAELVSGAMDPAPSPQTWIEWALCLGQCPFLNRVWSFKVNFLLSFPFFAIIHRTHSMTFRCFVSRPFSMENQQDQTMKATGRFEEWDAFREA